MTNRNEQRDARRVQTALNIPYIMALRLVREGKIEVRDGGAVIIDHRSEETT